MNKADLIGAMAEGGQIMKLQAEKSLSALADAIGAGLARGEKVLLSGLGTFSCVQRKTRTGRSPRPSKEIIPSRTAATFSPAALLKKQLNAGKKWVPGCISLEAIRFSLRGEASSRRRED